MKSNKFLVSICSMALVATLGVGTVFAEGITSGTESTKAAARPAISAKMEKRVRTVWTEEQKAEMEAKRASIVASLEKWEGLTDAQKEEIYALKDQAADFNGKIIDKYLEWGVIDEEAAVQMKERLSERKLQMRESGKMPMLHGKGGRGRWGAREGAPSADTAENGL